MIELDDTTGVLEAGGARYPVSAFKFTVDEDRGRVRFERPPPKGTVIEVSGSFSHAMDSKTFDELRVALTMPKIELLDPEDLPRVITENLWEEPRYSDIGCRDGMVRRCKIQIQQIPASGTSIRWCYVCSYYNSIDDWDVWIAYDYPDEGAPWSRPPPGRCSR